MIIFYHFNYYLIRAKLCLLLRRERCDLALKESVWSVIIKQIEIRIKRIVWLIEIEHKTFYFKVITFEKSFQNKLFEEIKKDIEKKLFNMNNETSTSQQDILNLDQLSLNEMITNHSSLIQSNLNQSSLN